VSPQVAPQDVESLRRWVRGSHDNGSLPFVIVDKRRARLWLYDDQGRLSGVTPVLLGSARGDASVPGIGERAIRDIRPGERTTPAGRFYAEQGQNAAGEDIFWVDYDAAVSMHRVRVNTPGERRLERLASNTPTDNRITYGCINVPVAFYDRQLAPLLTPRGGMVYLLPDTLPLRSVFSRLRAGQTDSGESAQTGR
jgi:hypothetical protein